MADAFNEKLAEAVRRFPALYDKSCPDYKDKNKRKLAWEDVSRDVGLESGKLSFMLFLSSILNVSLTSCIPN